MLSLAIGLETAAKNGNKPFSERELKDEWVRWYYMVDAECAQGFSPVAFLNTSQSIVGFVSYLTPLEVPCASTFAWLYFPTIFTVLYAIIWQLVDDDEVKKI